MFFELPTTTYNKTEFMGILKMVDTSNSTRIDNKELWDYFLENKANISKPFVA